LANSDGVVVTAEKWRRGNSLNKGLG